jgi:hypothetical protein
MDARHAERCT